MYLAVTIQAAFTQQVLRWHIRRQATFVLRNARMACLRMTALAKQRRSLSEHAGMIRTVRVVAQGAVLSHRRMFPKVGAAHLCMTFGTSLIYRLPGKQLFCRIAMRTMAATAIHLSLPNRMRIRFQCFCAHLLMAIKADVRLRRGRHERIPFGMRGMTIRTRDGVFIVTTALPGKAGIVLMAINTKTVLLRYRCLAIRAKSDYWRALLATPDSSCVISTRAVARFALQLTVTKR